MHLGHGSTKRERPRRAFEATRDNYSKKLDFGQSGLPEGSVYRRKGIEEKSWFWIILKVLLLVAVLSAIIQVSIEGYK